MIHALSRFTFILCSALVCVGCSPGQPKLVSVTGKVTMNAQPLTAGSINFHGDASNTYTKDKPSSLLQLDGSFTMKTFPFGDGVPPGKYKVTLAPELAGRISHPEYGKVDTTPWSIEVPDSGIEGHSFEVK